MQRAFITLFVLCAVVPSVQAAPVAMQPGEWAITTRMEIAGMPMTMPPMTQRFCYSKQEVQEHATVPAQRPNCTREYYHVSGSTVSWKMTCHTNGSVQTMIGTFTMTGTAYDGTMTTEAEGRKMVSHISGKRLGECTPK
ncbi:MAG: DUF3617 family protein [Betaproteobacteria bacterium]|nr:DUF3617 family protein [Betaproteobacteria bacterium]